MWKEKDSWTPLSIVWSRSFSDFLADFLLYLNFVINLPRLIKTCMQPWFCVTHSPLRRPGSSCFPTLILPLFYFAGNLAHTKGKGVNTLRSPRTPTRTITFAKVPTAPSASRLYYLLHRETSPEKLSIFFSLPYSKNHSWTTVHLLFVSTVFFISALLLTVMIVSSVLTLFCLLLSSSLSLCVSAFLSWKMGVLTFYSSFSFSEVINTFPWSSYQVLFYQSRLPNSLLIPWNEQVDPNVCM